MKPLAPHSSHRQPHPRQGGFALVLVLVLLILVTVLSVGFLSTVSTETVASKSASNTAGVHELANMAVQIAMGQIRQATTGTNASGGTLAWASQPGMIRTYDTTGAPYAYYKLYSSSNMVLTNPATGFAADLAADQAPANFLTNTTTSWTDLNAPVADSTGNNQYPIIDPMALTNGIQGFFTNASAPGYAGGTASATNNPLSMPVQWLYVLSNGSLAAMSSGTLAGVNSTNQIIGRIAFWTDDETSKVNINTAAEGTYWDTPRFSSTTPTANVQYGSPSINQSLALGYPDYAFSAYPPAQYEFQRYPGHPAQVALSTIFTNMVSSNAAGITPRLVWGGSLAGTTKATTSINLATSPRPPLYASVDELLFSSTNTSSRTPTTIASANITKQQLEGAKFFITANSRAPEVNLFNLPRIACWPVDASLATGLSNGTTTYTNRTTAYDRLIAYCASTSNSVTGFLPYYFQRSQSTNSTNDSVNIQRNQQLYAYLQALTSSNIPAFGGNFLTKYPSPGAGYPSDRDQILTEIFDYIRCINLVDPNLSGYPVTQAQPLGNTGNWPRTTNQFSTGVDVACNINGTSAYNLLGLGQVMPLQITNSSGQVTRGFGRITSLKELGLVFICTADGSGIPTDAITYFNKFTSANPLFMAAALNNYKSAFNGDSTCTTLTTNQIFAMISSMTAPGQLGLPTFSQVSNNYAALGIPSYLATNSTYWSGITNLWSTTWLPLVTNNPMFTNITQTNAATYYNPTLGGTPLTWKQKRLQVMLMPSLWNVGAGFINYIPDVIIGMGLTNFTISNAINIMGTNGGINGIALFPANYPDASGTLEKISLTGTTRPYNNPFLQADLIVPSTRVSTNFSSPWKNGYYPYYPFVSMPFTIDTNSVSTITFPANSITLSLYQGLNAYDYNEIGLSPTYIETTAPTLVQVTNNPANLIQTATITFPAASFPLPSLPAYSGNSANYWQAEDRLLFGNEGPNGVGVFGISFTNDVIRSMCFNGDGRLAALMTNIPSSYFTNYPGYSGLTLQPANQIVMSSTTNYPINGATTMGALVPSGTTATNGDFDMAAKLGPSPFINKADEGDQDVNNLPYYYWSPTSTNKINYTPNRIMPSPGMFGSLPTGVQKNIAWTTNNSASSPTSPGNWQTLLFRPQPGHSEAAVPATKAATNSYTTPPDHLIMDLFWMPIVEPYAISEAFSTDGKINMNYQIQPFTNIVRETALLAAMKIEMISAVPNSAANIYTTDSGTASYLTSTNWTSSTAYRKTLNLSDTNGSLLQFKQKFAAGDIFRSASEICDIYLVPNGQNWTDGWTGTAATAFWNQNLNTPDNLREKPYANLYAHLTTKANTFTVHFRVQTLKKVPSTAANTWVEGVDQVTGEYRGSSLIERYIDPSDPTLPDFTTNTALNINNWYKFRVNSSKKFAP